MENLTVEELESKLQELSLKVDEIAQKVVDGELDAYEGFTLSQKYNDEILKIGYLLKEKGIDITTRVD